MKRTVVTVLTGLLAVVASSLAFGAAGNVAYTVHNMSNYDPTGAMWRYIDSYNEDQICVFCHTPHNAQPSRPLWNKRMPTQSFNMYTSSSTLSAAAKGVTAPSTESLLCLSCHDGRTAINVLHNTSNTTALPAGSDKTVDIEGNYDSVSTPGGVGIALGSLGISGYGANLGKLGTGATVSDSVYGGNLTNDHPISFSYNTAVLQKGTSSLNDRATVDTKSASAIKFYGSDNRIECGSCHDPHVNYGADRQGNTWATGNPNPALKPFLRMSNQNSALCFACHNK